MTEPSIKRRPPVLVWVACALMGIFALLVALFLGAQLLAVRELHRRGDSLPGTYWLVFSVYLAGAVAYVISAIGLYRARAWARWTGIALTIINLVLGIAVPVVNGQVPDLFGLAIQAVLLVVLYRREVVEWVTPTGL